MAGLSSVMAITRPLGNVNLAAMNRCVGVYKVHLIGGGGGGGGHDSFYGWYGDAGSRGARVAQTGFLIAPMYLSAGSGGAPSGGTGSDDGSNGSPTVITARRGVTFQASGGVGGKSAYTARNPSLDRPGTILGKETSRFNYIVSSASLDAPFDVITVGRGGSSTSPGNTGGIIKAYRIG